MIIVRTAGGIGNQMFQYAFARSLAEKYNVPLLIDNEMQNHLSNDGFFKKYKNIIFRKYALHNFNISGKIAKRNQVPWYLRNYFGGRIRSILDGVRRRIFYHKGREKNPYLFEEKFLTTGPNVYLDGDWQCYQYFHQYQDILRKEFSLQQEPDDRVVILAKEIQEKNAICMHIRRGDYVGNGFHNLAQLDYYYQGVKKIQETEQINHIYVFSDDIEWCKENMQLSISTTFVDNSFSGNDGIWHFWLMQQCSHFVIANSSYSWWAAYLANSPRKKVVAPKKWVEDSSINTNDLCPPEWIRI